MPPPPAFELGAIRKAFGGTVAVDGVSLSAAPGEIVGLVGENGAGKSTLVKILSGVIPHGAYAGRVTVAGREQRFRSVADAEAAGVVAIPQELAIVPAMSVAENLFLNREPRRRGVVDLPAMLRRSRQVLAEFGLDVDPDRPAGSLSIAQQQVLEIVRALSREARVLILDEPTASLTQAEAERLFARLDALRGAGVCAVYISHRLDEIRDVADRVVVLRDGRVALEGAVTDLAPRAIVQAMVGRALEAGERPRAPSPGAEPVLAVRDLRVPDPMTPGRWRVDGVSFTVHRGEILGLFGAVGAGRTELLLALSGARPHGTAGEVVLGGRPVRIRSPRQAQRLGIALLTEDRKGLGLEPLMTLRENLTLGVLDRLSRLGVVDHCAERRVADRQARRLRIAASSLEQPAGTLSGGNQQKALLGRALLTEPAVLLLDEPTRGVDVGAKADISALLRAVAEQGTAVVMVSSEAPEVLALADRVLVLRDGRVAAELPAAGTSVTELVAAATGAAAALPGGRR